MSARAPANVRDVQDDHPERRRHNSEVEDLKSHRGPLLSYSAVVAAVAAVAAAVAVMALQRQRLR